MPTTLLRRAFFSTAVAAAAVYLYLMGKQSYGELGFGAQSGANSANLTTAAPLTRSPTVVFLNNAQPQVTSVGFTAGEAVTVTSGGNTVATGNFVAFSASANSALELTLATGTLPTGGATITGNVSGYSVTYPSGSEVLLGGYEPDTWLQVALRFTTSMGIKKDGSLWATGYNGYNQILSSSTNSVCVWTQLGTAKNWVSVAPGDEFLAALDSSGNVWTVGDNGIAAQCHNGISNQNAANVTSLYNTSTTSSINHPQIVSIATGGSALTPYELCYQGPSSAPTWKGRVLIHDATLGLLYYSNETGTLATGAVVGRTSGVSVTVTSATKSVPVWKSLYVGHRYVQVIDSHGYLFSWGNNGGDTECGRPTNCSAWPYTNTAFAAYAPQAAPAYLSDSSQADYCQNATQEWNCWPVTYPYGTGGTKFVSVFPGAYNCLALTAGGVLIGWGKNADYEMGATLGGDGSTPPHAIPCTSGYTWINADAGDYHCGYIRSDGTLFMGGKNASGQLGNASTVQPTDLVQVPNPVVNGVTGYWVAVSCGSTHTLAIDNLGNLWGWGDNSSFQLGQVGSGTMLANNQQTAASTYSSPILIDSSRKYTAISCGEFASLILANT